MLFRESPGLLKVSWTILMAGLVLACFGYLSESTWETVAGFGLIGVGYLAAFVDLHFRRENRDEAVPYYTAVVLSPLISLVLLAICAVVAGVFLLVSSLRNGFSQDQAMHLFHLLAILYAFTAIMSIPTIARSAKAREEATIHIGDTDEAGTSPPQ